MHVLANIFSYPLSNIEDLIIGYKIMKKRLQTLNFLRINRYLLRFTGIKINLLIDNGMYLV